MDPARLGIHGCSAGASLAIEFAADRFGVRALWLESPYADPMAMARHYLSQRTGLAPALLGLTSRFAVGRAVAHVRRELSLTGEVGGLETIDPLAAMSRAARPSASCPAKTTSSSLRDSPRDWKPPCPRAARSGMRQTPATAITTTSRHEWRLTSTTDDGENSLVATFRSRSGLKSKVQGLRSQSPECFPRP